MRTAEIKRTTKETDITLFLNLDGSGKSEIDTGCGFFDHMLTLFAGHGRLDLNVKCNGDTYVDFHHSIEDIGICLGQAFAKAIGDKRGIMRYGSIVIPMDETLILTSLDISGRSHLNFDVEIPTQAVGGMDTELIEEFFVSFVRNADVTLHIKKFAGKNTHHIIECIFKSFGRAVCKAVSEDATIGGEIPSTKGLL
ncbi:MAG: imidazoleglycerol-phosphate dehydratase HisB [Clostridia bacterium]|nr:imidazoleglycerol-phosphate dehydratase HisB [Clostridia bacterium]